MDVHAKVEELKKAIVLFEDMVAKYQILPAALTCTALIKGFCRGGRMDEAMELLKMAEMKCKADFVTSNVLHIIGPLMLNDDLNDLEFGRFAYNYDLELHEEMLDEVSSNIEKEAESKFIDRLLPSVKYEEDEEIKLKYEDCAICLNDYRDGELCRIFPMCKHMFHSDCIDIWLEKSLTCPICRQYVFGSS
ncbi:RING-H2 finger protein ATL16 [Manihot esculenta]|uniref:RING-H2 finger protein ATL16 n=1 Tax=Manihot esculenta TaxID=3983 RepID=UPI000B5D7E2E|nr:RING-H2 finger protein ATL16 [Manihot esculenta]